MRRCLRFLFATGVLIGWALACTSNEQLYREFVAQEGSMTSALKTLDPDLKLELLESGEREGFFRRTVVLSLQDKPVILAKSQTLTTNKTFSEILSQADRTPIGLRLFAKDSGIVRSEMKLRERSWEEISDPVLKNYLKDRLSLQTKLLTERTSVFRKGKETLEVVEFVLPEIKGYLGREKK